MKYLAYYFLSVILLLLAGCGSTEPVFSVVPYIEFVRITPTVIRDNEEIAITFKYQDGDGDLGYETADTNRFDCFVIVNYPGQSEPDRFTQPYNLPYLTPRTRRPSIQGEITIAPIAYVARQDPNAAVEEVDFTIYIKDRAGNQSNRIRTSKISIIP